MHFPLHDISSPTNFLSSLFKLFLKSSRYSIFSAIKRFRTGVCLFVTHPVRPISHLVNCTVLYHVSLLVIWIIIHHISRLLSPPISNPTIPSVCSAAGEAEGGPPADGGRLEEGAAVGEKGRRRCAAPQRRIQEEGKNER